LQAMARVDRFRIGSRWVETGHLVKVLPSRDGKKDGFVARVLHGVEREDGGIEVTVYGARGKKASAVRTFRTDRLKAMKQPEEVRPK